MCNVVRGIVKVFARPVDVPLKTRWMCGIFSDGVHFAMKASSLASVAVLDSWTAITTGM